ncbi:MAG: hypothetical protein LBJ92_03765 [Holosporales bacterium]|jgi:hypothetical protein|nr:hypothetical protein [Holosporales bacterium]
MRCIKLIKRIAIALAVGMCTIAQNEAIGTPEANNIQRESLDEATNPGIPSIFLQDQLTCFMPKHWAYVAMTDGAHFLSRYVAVRSVVRQWDDIILLNAAVWSGINMSPLNDSTLGNLIEVLLVVAQHYGFTPESLAA